MTDEEINRKFEVVADHLVTLAVGLQSLQEEVRRLGAVQARTDGSVRALLAAVEIQAQEIKVQSQEIKELSESVKAVDGRQREADERSRQTDENLNALINTVERYISERRKGKD
jgi:hypothetical protein